MGFTPGADKEGNIQPQEKTFAERLTARKKAKDEGGDSKDLDIN